MTRPVVTIASQATRARGSLARIASRMASEIWSASLSGWPSVTDSEVKTVDAGSRDIWSSFESPTPARTGHRQARARPQAPGSYLWDVVIVASGSPPGHADAWPPPRRTGGLTVRLLAGPVRSKVQVVDPRVPHQLGAS